MSNPYATSSSRPSNPSVSGQNIASAGKRIGGRLIDGLIVGIIGYILVASIAIKDGKVQTGKLVIASILGLVLSFVYEVPMVAATGQTLGKRLVGTRVVRLADGEVPGMSVSVTRWLPALVGIIPLLNLARLLGAAIGIGSLILLFTDPRRQTVNDKFAKTVVVIA